MPHYFGPKHLTGLLAVALGVTAILLFGCLFANKRGRTAKIWTLRGICIALLTLEFTKYLVLLHGDGVTPGAITVGTFPLHLCHMPLYFFPFVAFGNGKISKFLAPGAFSIGLIGGLIALAAPFGVLGDGLKWSDPGNEMAIISFAYHGLMIAFSLYMLLSRHYVQKTFDIVKAFLTIAGCAVVSGTANVIVPTADFMFLSGRSGSFLSFIVRDVNLFVYLLVLAVLTACALCVLYCVPLFKTIYRLITRKKQVQANSSEDSDFNK